MPEGGAELSQAKGQACEVRLSKPYSSILVIPLAFANVDRHNAFVIARGRESTVLRRWFPHPKSCRELKRTYTAF